MTNLQQSIEEQVNVFMVNVSTLVRQAAIEALDQAIVIRSEGAKSSGRATKKGGAGKKRRVRRKAAPARDPAQLCALTERLYETIAARPGETMQVLAAAVGCPSLELRVSIAKLVDEGRVKKTGERRLTRYFPMGAEN